MTYENLAGAVTQAHIHFGQAGTNAGISLFLCTNLGNGPVGTQPCPATADFKPQSGWRRIRDWLDAMQALAVPA